MRPRRGLAVFLAVASVLSARAGSAQSGVVTSAAEEAADSTWLPVPEEDLESLEPLEEEATGLRTGALIRTTLGRDRLLLRRVAVDLERPGWNGEIGALFEDRRVRPGARIALGNGRFSVSGGRISVTRVPPMLANALGLWRQGRRVPATRVGPIDAVPSRGASSAALDGAAVTLGTLWSFVGTRAGDTLGALGLQRERGRSRVQAVMASRGTRLYGSVTVQHRGIGSVELLAGYRQSRALLAEVISRGEGMLLSARWRYRSSAPVGAEVTAQTTGPGSRVRMTWRSWASAAAPDDGWLELEWSRGPVKSRLGVAGDTRERYGLIDATLARDSGRSLSLHALRRAAPAARGTAAATTLGARLDLRGGWGTQAIVVETTRVRRGATAWGVALSPSGEVTLRSRSRPGLWASARGSLGRGGWRLGYQLERGEDVAGPRPWGGTLWVRRLGR